MEEVQLYRASVEILVWEPNLSARGYHGKLLTVTNRRWGGFSCPGGKVQKDEPLEVAARRELLEETGLEAVELWPLVGGVHYDEPKDGGPPWFCMAFTATVGDQLPSQQEEGTEIGWHTPRQLAHESIYPDWYKFLFGAMQQIDY